MTISPEERAALLAERATIPFQLRDAAAFLETEGYVVLPTGLRTAADALEAAEQQLAEAQQKVAELRVAFRGMAGQAGARERWQLAAEAEIAMLRQELGTLNAAEREIAELRGALEGCECQPDKYCPAHGYGPKTALREETT